MKKNERAPELSGGPWLNSEPLSIAELRGKVVLVDFWTYTCINCLRTLPYLKEWHRRYAPDGLVVIGVHSPEFVFERNPENVKDFLIRNEIEYPVVLDNDYKIWSAYANRYWPHHYFADKNGYIAYDHIGEGDYERSELVIQALLQNANPKLAFPAVSRITKETEDGAVCSPVSTELYVGFARGSIGNPVGLTGNKPQQYVDGGTHDEGLFYLSGTWLEAPDYARHMGTGGVEGAISIHYRGLEVNAVMGPWAKGRSFKARVTRDGARLPKNAWGADIQENEEDPFVLVDSPRMYRVVEETVYGEHDLTLHIGSDQMTIYAFTFGSCIVPQTIREEQRKIA
ncbi:MAG: thioredoxin family protein [Chloroflexi bacterium]|nr:thioredoxin family protein [Chloroflexota bacterium]